MGYDSNNIRNIAVVGHSGEGKTSLCEAILFNTKATDRLGKTVDGNTVMDFDEQEIAKKISISLAVASCEWKNVKLNLIDVPGFYDFEGELVQAMVAADSAIVVTGPWGEVSVGCEKSIESCTEKGLPIMIFINQIDKENANFFKAYEALREKYGTKIAMLQLPIIIEDKMKGYISVLDKKAYKFADGGPVECEVPENLIEKLNTAYNYLEEVAAENDDVLLDKFFSGAKLTNLEVVSGVRKGIAKAKVMPVLAGSATDNKGVFNLMNEIVSCMPSPEESKGVVAISDSGEEYEVNIDKNKPLSVQVFKTIADPFVGKMNLIKVITGSMTSGVTVLNTNADKQEKVGSLLILKGKKQSMTDVLDAGDIGALAKLQYTNTGDTLCDLNTKIKYKPIDFPKPVITLAVGAVKEGEEEKVIQGLYRLLEEDSTFSLDKSSETGEMLINGMGETHLDIICKKVKSKFKVEALLSDPKIAYRETIKKTVIAEGKHKKQSGGHGQYGHCKIRFEYTDAADFVFEEEVVGGSVPKAYYPAVEKGLRECILKGILAGFPVVNLKAVLTDGSYHDVDSSEMAFKLAAAIAYKEGLKGASPVLLEPVYLAEIIVPESYMGDILGDMNKRRGRILGMDLKEDKQVIRAEVPQAEVFKYATDLRSMTQGRGKFSMKFVRYDEVPSAITQKIIAKYAKADD